MSSDDDQNSTPICTVDPYEYLQIKPNPDGTITRLIEFPSIPATPDPASPSPVLTNDFPLNPTHNTFVRVYVPKLALSGSLSSKKLPIIIYYHGGGFVLLHADSALHDVFCSALASHAAVIVISVEYRLAPEHRLPAAYEDAVEALHWTAAAVTDKNEWLTKYGDSSNCYLMGSSAGGNIAYHAALRASDHMDDLQPVRLKGLILHQPFFGGSGRTESELRLLNDPWLPLSGSDMFWELSLPVGSGRDHEFCNPLLDGGPGRLERAKELGWRVLVTGCSGDPLVDRLKEFVKMLKRKGVEVEEHFTEGDYHGVDLVEPEKTHDLGTSELRVCCLFNLKLLSYA
ncbi:hypothetical protein Cgig2_010552 [Carnegiea gigantea]|uniref:Alpha/beta hydrolase fold-3 domain-containing protein n=1 Tax=Carnegiea gigantea TaxID=171969 RepID=A0A9Q1QQI9_9CARY|nr:hypothetical protein Cgig2_010552 [Carnegiea gigantea]